MKKFFLLFVTMIPLLIFSMTGCGEKETSREDVLKASLERTYNELTSTFSGETGQYDLVSEYLKSWANKNEIEIAHEHENYTVLVNPATEGVDDADTVVLQCAIKTHDFSTSLQTLAASLTSLLGPETHGKITLIVTENNDGAFLGAAALKPEHFKGDHFINMEHSDDVQLFTFGSHEQAASMSSRISTTEPAYSQAYSITMSTSGAHDPFGFDGNHYPNPVEVIGNLLASAKSSGVLFELASFECEAAPGYTPASANAIVVIDANNVSAFTKKFYSSYKNMQNRFEKLEDNFVYTFTETTMPAKVLTSESSDNIISLMYTLKAGIYFQDEDSGEVIAASDLTHVSTLDKKFSLDAAYRSSDPAILEEMSNVFLTTSGLCNIKYKSGEDHITWSSDEKKGLADFFIDALGTEDSIFTNTLESTEMDILSAKEPMNAISYRFNIHHGEAATANLLHFMESVTPEVEAAEEAPDFEIVE